MKNHVPELGDVIRLRQAAIDEISNDGGDISWVHKPDHPRTVVKLELGSLGEIGVTLNPPPTVDEDKIYIMPTGIVTWSGGALQEPLFELVNGTQPTNISDSCTCKDPDPTHTGFMSRYQVCRKCHKEISNGLP